MAQPDEPVDGARTSDHLAETMAGTIAAADALVVRVQRLVDLTRTLVARLDRN